MEAEIKPLSETEKKIIELYNAGIPTQVQIGKMVGVDKSTVCRAISRIKQDFPDLIYKPDKKISLKDRRKDQEPEQPQEERKPGLHLKEKRGQGLHLKTQTAEGASREPQRAAEQESKAEPEKPLNEADTQPDKVEQKSVSDQDVQEAPQAEVTIKAENPTGNMIKPAEKANTKPDKVVFSFRAERELVKQWRAYAASCLGMKVDDLGVLAMQEYIRNHPLSGVFKEFYEEKMKS